MLRLFFALLASSALLVACADTEAYPLSGEECTASDPVLDLDAADCYVPNA